MRTYVHLYGVRTYERTEKKSVCFINIDYEILLQTMPGETVVLQEILELMVDVVCTTNDTVFISGDNKPTAVVMSQFLKLNSEHIRFVIDGLNENTTRIRNMRQYLLATLYNAPLTMDNHYRSLIAHNMALSCPS